jgi:tetratricopeptide (TPR) repeat protein
MARVQHIIREIHRRSLWQALAIYVGISYAVLEAADLFVERFGLPGWLFPLAFVLLLLGLPVVLTTAFLQMGGKPTLSSDPTLIPGAEVAVGTMPVAHRRERKWQLRGLFTWRNVALVGVAACALWGVATLSWLLAGFPGLFLVKAEAAEFVHANDRVVVADFENETDEPALALAVREAIITDLDQSEYVEAVERNEIAEVLRRMRLPDTAVLTEPTALEIARREGHPAVVAGSVARLGSGYQLSARVLEAASGDVAVRLRETANDESEIVASVERLSRLVRRHLGESLSGLRHSDALPQVATSSLEALKLYARGISYGNRGEYESAIPLLEQAVALDTSFASAYRALSIFNGNMGNAAAGQRYVARAYAHSDRLVPRERYLVGALYHSYLFRLDSAVHYYRLELERDPDSYVAINNLGDLYERVGRYEEALPLYRRTVELEPERNVPYINLASLARTLGMRATADSALAILVERFPDAPSTQRTVIGQAIYFDDFATAESLAREVADDRSEVSRAWADWFMSSLPAARGHIATALAYGDSAIQKGASSGVTLISYLALHNLEAALLAAGAPERALPYVQRVERMARAETEPVAAASGLVPVAAGYALAGDLRSARAVLAHLDSLVEASGLHPAGGQEHIRAIIALQEEQPQEALEHLQAARRNAYGLLRRATRLMLGDTYAALGRWPEAAAQYDSLTSSYRLNWTELGLYAPLRPVGHERAASAYLAAGDTTAALRHLARFVELWEDADPELQSRVAAARRMIEALARDR